MTRDQVIEITRTWKDTPYRHQASLKGVGCDCLGMLRGVFRELYSLEKDPEPTPPYRRDWYERTDKDLLLEVATRHLQPIAVEDAGPGDVVVFRMKSWASAKHCAILTGLDTMIHAYDGHRVVEVNMGNSWKSKIAGAFRFPGLED